MSGMLRKISIVALLLLLQACQLNPPKPPSYDSHQSVLDLSQRSNFTFSGKMSFSDGTDGGSGRITWQQLSDGYIVADFKAPLGSQSWQLEVTPTAATLTDRNGQSWMSQQAGELLSDQLGWPVPWHALTYWVQGQKDHEAAIIKETEDGYLINSGGWQISYRKLVEYPGGLLPHKMQARRGEHVIKLAIKQWDL